MGDITVSVTSEIRLESGYYVRLFGDGQDVEQVEFQIGGSTYVLTNLEAKQFADLLNLYADGFVFPPGPAVKEDTHVAFPEKGKRSSAGPVA